VAEGIRLLLGDQKTFLVSFLKIPQKLFFSNISTKGQISHIGSSIILVENKSGRKPQAKGLKPMQYKSLIVLVSVGSVSFAVVSVSSLLLVGR